MFSLYMDILHEQVIYIFSQKQYEIILHLLIVFVYAKWCPTHIVLCFFVAFFMCILSAPCCPFRWIVLLWFLFGILERLFTKWLLY